MNCLFFSATTFLSVIYLNQLTLKWKQNHLVNNCIDKLVIGPKELLFIACAENVVVRRFNNSFNVLRRIVVNHCKLRI